MPAMNFSSLKKIVGEFYATANYFIPIQAYEIMISFHTIFGGRRDRVRMVVGSTTTYATRAYHH
jgi:hypothetical protein